MRHAIVVTLNVLFLAATSLAWEHISGKKQSLRKNFEIFHLAMVAFVSPSQPKSQSFEAEWLQAAETTSPVPLLSVDCDAQPSVCGDYGVESPPSIQLFQRGASLAVYQGPRRAGAIANFVARWQRDVVTVLGSAEELTSFKTADETVFVAYLAEGDETDVEARKAFDRVAEAFRAEFSFGVVTDPAIWADQSVQGPAVVCYKLVDGDTVTFSSSFTEEGALEKFVVEASRPIISELTTLNHQRLLDRAWPMVYLFAPTEPERASLRKALYSFARDQYSSLTSATVDPFEFPDLQASLGLEPGVFPAGAVHQLSKDRIYPYPKGQPYSSGALQKWGLDVYQGRVRPWTPPGVTTSYDDLGFGGKMTATRKISIASNWPGAAKIKIAGRDEL